MSIDVDSTGPSEDETVLAHYGVKGMRWGVVKEQYRELKNTPTETVNLTTAKGVAVTLKETPTTALGAGLGTISSRFRKLMKESRGFDVEVNGKTVGDVALREKSSEEVNFVWVGINPKERGNGYASTVFDAGIAYAKSKGYSKISLEVPGNAPDARHIYEKRGFIPTGEVIGNERDIWGGLTVMTYDIPK